MGHRAAPPRIDAGRTAAAHSGTTLRESWDVGFPNCYSPGCQAGMQVCSSLEVLLKIKGTMVKKIKKFAVSHVPFQVFSVKEKARCVFFLNRAHRSLFNSTLWKQGLQTFASRLEKYNSIFTFLNVVLGQVSFGNLGQKYWGLLESILTANILNF